MAANDAGVRQDHAAPRLKRSQLSLLTLTCLPAISWQFLAARVLWWGMASATLNVSLSKEQLAQVNREVDSGQYVSASEVVHQALREWLDRRIKADLAALEKNHKGALERDTTPEEEALILAAKREARAELVARGKEARK
jgi:Arc/MetJ-type ribon-helix-helix transcriptional regulator